jgi:uncharacterized damage-inducible protein DinB
MLRAQDAIAVNLEASQKMLNRFLEDLTPKEYLHRAVPAANCAAWIVGHLVLAERRWLTLAGSQDLPSLPDGFEQRFARTEEAAKAPDFGDVSVLRPLFNEHRRRFIETMRSLADDLLDRPVGFTHAMFQTVGQAAAFSAVHVGMHCGQISTIRRSLGRPPLI